MKNAFTVDLEDWFCSHNLKSFIAYEDWDKMESRVEANTEALLNLLARKKVTATFFVLGWIATRYPQLIEAIYKEGHEIASHGYAHRQITFQTPEEFESDIVRCNVTLNAIVGEKPKGYRAPAFSITKDTLWALDILKKNGFTYDSSIYPFSFHPDYGYSSTKLTIHQNGQLIEVPLSCATFYHRRIPCSGGAYLRFYPYRLFRSLAKRVVDQNRPFIFYIHPWELDKNPPKIRLPMLTSVRHYYNYAPTLKKIGQLVEEFEFTSLEDVLRG